MDVKHITALDAKVNAELYNSAVKFILENRDKETDIKGCLERNSNNPLLKKYLVNLLDIGEVYGVRYIGEFYERYEAKGINTARDIRAIALALADTVTIHSRDMFVGTQKEDFIAKIKKMYEDKFDPYLGIALIELMENGKKNIIITEILEKRYSDTEDLLFVVSVLAADNAEDIFIIFKEQLLDLLGKKRNFSIIGNIGLYGIFIKIFAPVLKKYRKKDAKLLKILSVMDKERLCRDTAEYKLLTENGYNEKEIFYVNYFVCLQTKAKEGINTRTLVYERLAVDLCKAFIKSKIPLTEAEKEIFYEILDKYKKFSIACDGKSSIKLSFENERFGCSDTFLWLLDFKDNVVPHYTSDLYNFDILGDNSSEIIKNLDDKYKYFFLNKALSMEDDEEIIKKYIAEFEKYDNFNYIETFKDLNNDFDVFRKLVDKGIIDLLQFVDKIKTEGYNLKSLICSYIAGIQNLRAFEFVDAFDKKHDIANIEDFLGFDIYRSCFVKKYGNKKFPEYTRDIFTRKQHRDIVAWIARFVYMSRIDEYPDFVLYILRCESIFEIFTKDEMHDFFIVSIDIAEDKYPRYYFENLYERYLYPDELAIRKNKLQAEKIAKEESDKIKAELETINNFKKKFDGNLSSIGKFIDSAYYYKNDAFKVSFMFLEEFLKRGFSISDADIVALCGIYFKAFNSGYIDYNTFFRLISEAEKLGNH